MRWRRPGHRSKRRHARFPIAGARRRTWRDLAPASTRATARFAAPGRRTALGREYRVGLSRTNFKPGNISVQRMDFSICRFAPEKPSARKCRSASRLRSKSNRSAGGLIGIFGVPKQPPPAAVEIFQRVAQHAGARQILAQQIAAATSRRADRVPAVGRIGTLSHAGGNPAAARTRRTERNLSSREIFFIFGYLAHAFILA